MTSSNVKTVYQTSLLHIEINLDRLRLLSPTHGQRPQQQRGHITLQSVLLNKPEFLKATYHTEIRKNKIPRSMVMEALSWGSRRASVSIQPSKAPCIPEKEPQTLPTGLPLLVGLRRKKTDRVQRTAFPSEMSASRL